MILLVLACATGARCDVDADCLLGEMCMGSRCTEVVCTTNRDCAMEEHCTEDRQCVPGCEYASDCYPGDLCAADGSCVVAECVETATDCGWGELCEEGLCVSDLGVNCSSCEDDEDCQGGVCWSGYCGERCTSREDCPAGFDCEDVQPGADEVLACVSACWQY